MTKGVWPGLAMVFTGLAVAGVVFVRRLQWTPAAPFDIIGFLWLLTNLVPLLAVAGVLACAVCAVYCWLRVLQAL